MATRQAVRGRTLLVIPLWPCRLWFCPRYSWMDMRRQAEAFRDAVGDTHVPFLKIMGDPDLYCFGKDGRIAQWSHETGEFSGIDKSFAEVLDFELAELKTRKERKKAQRAAG